MGNAQNLLYFGDWKENCVCVWGGLCVRAYLSPRYHNSSLPGLLVSCSDPSTVCPSNSE